MNWFTALFNFDDIGGKIKSITKWFCWITILLLWVGSIIAFFAFLFTELAAFALLIPVGAIVGTLTVWIASLPIYAFGEIVERVVSLDYKAGKEKKSEVVVQPVSQRVEVPAPAVAPKPVAPAPKPLATVLAAVPAATRTAAPQPEKKVETDPNAYVAGRMYHTADKVIFEGEWYECTVDPGVSCVWNPRQNPAQWRKL